MRLLAAGLAFALASARPAAADEAEETARRMDDRLFFVQGIGGYGWKPFLDDVTRAIAETPAAAATPIRRVRDEGAAVYSEICAGRGTVAGRDEAYGWYETLAKDAVDAAMRPEYARRGAEIDVTRAQEHVKAGRDEEARAALVRGLELCPGYVPALDALTAVVLRQADMLSAEGREDYDGAVRALDDGVAHLPADSGGAKKIAERRRSILASTGTVAVEWLGDAQALGQVPGARTDYRTASLVFRPEPAGVAKGPPPRPLASGKPVRVRHGRFRVTARAEGGTDQDGGVVEVEAAEAVVALVTVVPDGMVVVRSPAPADWFLADRTEVSNADFKRVMARSAGRDDRAPAAGVKFAEAQLYASRVAKKLPTREQWAIAAFGSPAPAKGQFPWGGTAASPGRHFVGGVESPGPVDGCPEGASPFGLLNMAGNVWEWLSDGWLIGGGWTFAELSAEFAEAEQDRLRMFHFLQDPVPTEDVYRTLSAADRNIYWDYRARSETTLSQAGLRCVIPLGRPRRQAP